MKRKIIGMKMKTIKIRTAIIITKMLIMAQIYDNDEVYVWNVSLARLGRPP